MLSIHLEFHIRAGCPSLILKCKKQLKGKDCGWTWSDLFMIQWWHVSLFFFLQGDVLHREECGETWPVRASGHTGCWAREKPLPLQRPAKVLQRKSGGFLRLSHSVISLELHTSMVPFSFCRFQNCNCLLGCCWVPTRTRGSCPLAFPSMTKKMAKH